ncbi:MAG: hypothetical protein Q8P31_02130 [Bacillota bacterium]|nr:hypothetical protein [Bacillota bacterium]
MAAVWPAKLGPVTVIIGEFGSGKTEVAINCVLAAAMRGQPVTLVDLDTVTPAFRSRQAAEQLTRAGVRLVAPEGELADADLPAISSEVHAALADRRRAVVIDVGGSPSGARAVSSLADLTGGEGAACWVVVNPWRPTTANPRLVAGTVTQLAATARAGAAEVLANLYVPQDVADAGAMLARGYEAVSLGAGLAGLPLRLCSVRRELASLAEGILPSSVAVLPLDLFMQPPWDVGLEPLAQAQEPGSARLAARVMPGPGHGQPAEVAAAAAAAAAVSKITGRLEHG